MPDALCFNSLTSLHSLLHHTLQQRPHTLQKHLYIVTGYKNVTRAQIISHDNQYILLPSCFKFSNLLKFPTPPHTIQQHPHIVTGYKKRNPCPPTTPHIVTGYKNVTRAQIISHDSQYILLPSCFKFSNLHQQHPALLRVTKT